MESKKITEALCTIKQDNKYIEMLGCVVQHEQLRFVARSVFGQHYFRFVSVSTSSIDIQICRDVTHCMWH